MAKKFWRWEGRSVDRSALEARLGAARSKLSEYEAKLEKATRDLERYRRPDLVRKAERAGRMAERKLTEYSERERRLTVAIGRGDTRKRTTEPKPKKAAGVWVYHPKVSYMARRNHEATVEVSFRRRDGGRMSSEEVQSALFDLVKGKDRSDLAISAVRYGRLEAEHSGRVADLRAFIGVVMSGNLETIGEEKTK